MRRYVFTAVWGVIIWFAATLFFRLFGDRVLAVPGEEGYLLRLFLLLAGTAVLLYGVTSLYLRFDVTQYAAAKFGIIGTITGLILDTITLSYHQQVFPSLEAPQLIAFTAWLTFAYALFLCIPLIIQQNK
ncbi:DUF5367 family protein [Gracilibacillus alcaliphilus]|uniref:DUF5367 family protein n=1 Tax=Gracilibacillus alcaliphilus TaxID=1401441 RepID=UPI00195A108A|nr:DUF5367 family protein [Gracilibacillus alcaliphilus]MBM7675113.1 hypothetical protein [Gracilibacillus alcaliphilus]